MTFTSNIDHQGKVHSNDFGIFLLMSVLFIYEKNYIFISSTFVVFILIRFIRNFSKEIPIIDLLLLFAGIQSLLIPSLQDYLRFPWYQKLSISLEQYFEIAIPGIFSLAFGALLPIFNKKNICNKIFYDLNNTNYEKLGITMIFLGIAARMLHTFLGSISVLGPIITSLGNLVFIGSIYIYYSNHKYKNLIIVTIITLTLLLNIIGGLFWEFFIWTMFVLMLISSQWKTNFLFKIFITIFAIISILLIQNVKIQYRNLTWKGEHFSSSGKVMLFSNLIYESGKEIITDFNIRNLVLPLTDRMNQGKLDAYVFSYIPLHKDFADGRTISDSFLGAFIPRIFWPDKPGYDTRKLKELGGYSTLGNSFLSLSPLGETYGNFGTLVGSCFLFFYGLLINYLHFTIIKAAKNKKYILLFSPLLFYNIIRFEVDFTHVFSGFFTGLISIFVILLILEHVFNIRLD
jgi:hypothetical protein